MIYNWDLIRQCKASIIFFDELKLYSFLICKNITSSSVNFLTCFLVFLLGLILYSKHVGHAQMLTAPINLAVIIHFFTTLFITNVALFRFIKFFLFDILAIFNFFTAVSPLNICTGLLYLSS